MAREMCYRCFWPKSLCWCGSVTPIDTLTKFVILMHPKEYKMIRAGTGRFTHICLTNSEIHMGIGFDDHGPVQKLIQDPTYSPVLLYPGADAVNLSEKGSSISANDSRPLCVFILDATWILAEKMYKSSNSLQKLPKLMFTPSIQSRYVIKKQPKEFCLSTLEATHELLLTLEKSGIDRYERPDQMLDLFDRMQKFQVACLLDPNRRGYRRWATDRHQNPADQNSGTDAVPEDLKQSSKN